MTWEIQWRGQAGRDGRRGRMEKIVVQVDPEAARVYREASPELRAKMNMLISLQILDAEKHPLSVRDLMDLISTKAKDRGLTEQ
jgi:hypothetical protein